MKWTKFTLSTVSDAVDLISDMLMGFGIDGIEVVDNIPITEQEKKAMFIDILPEVDLNDNTAKISFYLEEEEDIQEALVNIQEGLSNLSEIIDIGSGLIEISETQDVDWINNWKAFFKPFRIDDTIVIKPTWEILENVSEKDLVIEIDPGTAFGTGAHETTKLCILGLKKYMSQGATVLDVGCGSGILSIAAAKLGATEILSTDIDPIAVRTAYDNAEVNHIPSKMVTILSGDIITNQDLQQKVGMEKYDIVVANILADVIIPLSAEIGQHIKANGLFISSGIINTKRDQVKDAILKNNFKIIEINELGDWVSIVAQKTQN